MVGEQGLMQPMEDFIVEPIARGDPSILDRILGYIQGEMILHGANASIERDRIAHAVADKAPYTDLRNQVVDLIRAQNA
jgi:hypothetical protein